jgi:histone H3/H4
MRLVREILHDLGGDGEAFRIQRGALEALQEAAESTLVKEFESQCSYFGSSF